MSYSSHKFNSATTDVLYSLMDWWSSEATGDADSPAGWFTQPIEISSESLADSDLKDALNQLQADYSLSPAEVQELCDELTGVHILSGDDQGFVWSERFESLIDALIKFDELETIYGAWLNQCADCGGPTHPGDDDNEEGTCIADTGHTGRMDS